MPGRLSNSKFKDSPAKKASQKGSAIKGSGGFATALFITPPKVSGSANGCFNGSSGVGVYGGGGPGILIASSNGKGSSEGNSSMKKKNEMEAYCS